MAHEQEPDIGALVLQGNHREAVDRAYLAYRQDPQGKIVMYASTLYSAWNTRDVHEQFEAIIDALIERIETELGKRNADALDVISTILTWWAYEYGNLGPEEKEHVVNMATCAASWGIALTDKGVPPHHTRLLLMLTRSELWIRSRIPRERTMALETLPSITILASCILDPNQRARIYRKAGRLYLMVGDLFHAIKYLWRARNVPGIAPDVRAKNPI